MPRNPAVRNRWIVVGGGILVQLGLGVIYAWPVFTLALRDAGWTRTQTQLVFSTQLATFAIVMVVAGRLLGTVGPRALALAGGLTLGLGYLAAGLSGGTSFPAVLVSVGLVGGAGIGLGYVVPIAVGMRWFPDRKGMITGIAVAGFGFGATLWVKLADNWGHLLADHGLGGTFAIIGLVLAALVAVGSIWMVFPPDGWKPAGRLPRPAGPPERRAGAVEMSSEEMLRTRQYWLLMTAFALGASAGLMAVGLLKIFPTEALSNAMHAAAAAAGGTPDHQAIAACAGAIAGNATAFCFPLANGLGRLAWGAVSDWLGRPRSIAAMMALQGLTMFLFPAMAGSEYLLYLGTALVGFNFGGNFALFPAATADFFGARNVGRNYGWIFLAYAVGGILGPVMGGKLGDLGNFPLAFTICGVLCLLAATMALLLRPLATRERRPGAVGGETGARIAT